MSKAARAWARNTAGRAGKPAQPTGSTPACFIAGSMIFSDLASPAEASSRTTDSAKGFAQAGNRYPTFRDHALGSGKKCGPPDH